MLLNQKSLKLKRRPTLDPDWGPSVIIGFRGTKGLKDALHKKALKYGLTYSKFIRAIVIEALEK